MERAQTRLYQLLAQRPPFLFLDDIVDYEERHLTAIRFIDPSDYYFEGHFPDEPIVPGAIIVEMMAQACGALVRLDFGAGEGPATSGRLAMIEKCRFSAALVPGDRVTVRATRLQRIGAFHRVNAEVHRSGLQVASAILLIAPGPLLQPMQRNGDCHEA